MPLAERSSPELRTPLLTLAAYAQWHRGDLDQARQLAERACRDGIVAAVVDPLSPHCAAIAFAMTAGDHARAFEFAATTRALVPDVDNAWSEARFLAEMASFEAMAGDFDAAGADSERALELARRLGSQLILSNALNGRAWALQRDDPEEASAVAAEFLDVYRRGGARSTAPGLMALAASLRARLGDDQGALALLREAAVIARDDGVLPQAAATLGFALNPLRRTGRSEVAAVLLGGLDHGALAYVANFPGTADARARALARIRDALGDEKIDQLVTRGASMTYDELIAYAIEHLGEDLTGA